MASGAAPALVEVPACAHRDYLLPLVLFCLGHFFVDLYSGALGAFQPVLVGRFHLSFTQAGILGATLVCSSSVMQPLYGYLSDLYPTRLFSVLAPAVAGVFISSLMLAPSWWVLLVMVWLGGAGIASFHPQGASNAVAKVKEGRSRAMAIFICSGSIGMACGPAYFSAAIGRLGSSSLEWAGLPAVVLTGIMLAFMPPIESHRQASRKFDWTPLRAVRRPLSILFLLVFLRSVVQITFTQFLPLYLHTQRGYSLTAANLSLSLYLLGGSIGGFAGGSLADRFGGRSVIIGSMIGSVPFLALFVFGQGILSAAGLFLGGLLLLFTIPVNVVMAQELAPQQAGTVSALMMGFGWGTAGLVFIPLTGWVADAFSMQAAFSLLIAFPLLGFLLALRLPK
jgi:FSR family fosmidomycin resistance protein-like MFS transporter